VIETVAACPTAIDARSLSTTSGRHLVGRRVDDDGVSGRGIETGYDVDRGDDAVDRGGQGRELDLGREVVVRLARIGELRRGAVDTQPGLARRGGRRRGRQRVVRVRQLDLGTVHRRGRIGVLALEVGRVGGREDRALLDRIADLDFQGRDPPRR